MLLHVQSSRTYQHRATTCKGSKLMGVCFNVSLLVIIVFQSYRCVNLVRASQVVD